MNELLISRLNIYTEQGVFPQAAVTIREHRIQEIFYQGTKDTQSHSQQLQFPANYHLIPGRIDLHLHGAGGVDVMDATPKALQTICQSLAAEGVTGFLATTMTQTPEKIAAALHAVHQYQQQNQPVGAQILGVHLEGPFISPRYLGAHRAELILPIDGKLFNHWQACAGNWIKLVTLAPELEGGIEFIHQLVQQGIVAAIGHSDAGFAITEQAINAGASYATHLFNAMRGFHHRDPGCAGGLLIDDRVIAELIVDGYHLHPAAVQLALRSKGFENLVLVTDAMRAKCCASADEFDLGGQQVFIQEGAARLSDGTLAGSVTTMPQVINHWLAITHGNLTDAIQLTSVNPARILNLTASKGSIAPGKDADLVVLDENYQVMLTISRGKIIYEAPTKSHCRHAS